MSTLRPLYASFGTLPRKLSKLEKTILSAEFVVRICKEFKKKIKNDYKEYFRTINFPAELEEAMLDASYLRFVIKDILLTGEYTLAGIAYYTRTPEDVVYEIAAGCNTRPSALFLERIIELHQSVKPEFYQALLQKIVSDYSLKQR